MKDPQNPGPPAEPGKRDIIKPVALAAPTEVESRLKIRPLAVSKPPTFLEWLVNASFQALISNAPTAVNMHVGKSCDSRILVGGYAPTSLAAGCGGENNDDMKNREVHPSCAMNPSRPPTPTIHFFRSKSTIKVAQTQPKTEDAYMFGMTTLRAMPAKEPQKAARANFSGKIMVAIIPTKLDAIIGPTNRKLFKKKVRRHPQTTEDAIWASEEDTAFQEIEFDTYSFLA